MTETDAQILLGLVTAIVIPFAVLWIPRLSWPGGLKWLLATAISLVGGYLTLIVTGQFRPDASLIQNASYILTASQAIYYSAFKGLGLETWMFPRSAVAAEASDMAKLQVENTVSKATAKEILSAENDTCLNVQTEVTSLGCIPENKTDTHATMTPEATSGLESDGNNNLIGR